jgi:RNA polymerase sigma factor (sigma-70 family)
VESLENIEWEVSYTEDYHVDEKNKIEEVLEYIRTLSEKEQSIIMMRIWDDLSYEEIATITHESQANIRKILSRSLAKISANISPLCLFLLFY